MTVNNELIAIGDTVIHNRSASLWLPEYVMPEFINSKIPDERGLFTQAEVQGYPIGAQLRMQGCLWRYSKAGAAWAGRSGFLKGNYTLIPGKGNNVGTGFEGGFYEAGAVGDTSFKIADTAATKNLYAGGMLVIYDTTNDCYQQYRIIGNDATNDTTTTLYIAPPGFKYAPATTGSGITVYLNHYQNIRDIADGGGWMSALGYARLVLTNGFFFWLVTAGPISSITGATEFPGKTQYQRDVFCNTDGSLITGDSGTTELYQRVGFLLNKTQSDYGDNMIMLQLDSPE